MPSKKRWFRFSLRTFLVSFTFVAIAIAWFAHYANQRRAAFAAIRQAGGDILMGIREPSLLEEWFGAELVGSVNKVDLRKGKADNELLTQIGVLKELRRLDLSNADIDDEGLRRIAHLPLRELWLQETNITDVSAVTLSQIRTLDFLQLNATSLSNDFLKHLAPLPELEDLGMRGTQVTSVGMKYLSRHPKLKKLDVYSTAVDDSGVQHLVACQSLTDVGLSLTKITDRVFQHLAKLPDLTDVDLHASPVTTEAVLAFEKAHPKCDIEWSRKSTATSQDESTRPSTARDYYERGLKEEKARRHEEALASLTKAIELDPEFVDAYFSRSSFYAWHPSFEKRNYAKAVADLTTILEITPTYYSARLNRGLCYESLRKYDNAIADYSKIIDGETEFSRTVSSKEKNLAHTYHYRGRVYHWHKQQYAKAVADYTEALRLDPQIEMVHYRRGQAYNALKEYAKAEADFAIAIERDPNYPNLIASWAWQLATCPEAKFRDGDKAVELLKKMKPNTPRHLDVLAAAYAELGRFDDAAAIQMKAIGRLRDRAFGMGLRSDMDVDLKTVMQARLQSYQAKRAFRDH